MIRDLHRRVAAGETTFEANLLETFGHIERREPDVRGYVTILKESSLEKARVLDGRIRRGDSLGILAGVPVAAKDNLCTRGIRTTCGSAMLENFIPPYNATVVEKLDSADAILIGKTNLDEFAMGSSTETSRFGPTRNPHDPSRIPGGSSGGSAAVVAAGEAMAALGSDTGGSIRQPASHCGVVGVKPTYGRVSRYGLVAFASSLDQIGPFAGSIEDAALVLQAIAGHDPRDSTSIPHAPPDFLGSLGEGVRGVRIGLPREYFGEGLMPEVSGLIMENLRRLEKQGARLVDISLPHLEYAIAAYYVICTAEASSNLARYDGVKFGARFPEPSTLQEMYCRTRRDGFGAEVKRRIMLGTYVLSAGYYDAYYLKASRVRTKIVSDYKAAWEVCDVIASPVAPAPAFGLGEKVNEPLQMYLSDIYTISLNLAGLPGLSVPCGKVKGLPVGLQLAGKELEEAFLFRIGSVAERIAKN